MAEPVTPNEPPEKGTEHVVGADTAHVVAHDDHDHGHGHAPAVTFPIIPEESGADAMLTWWAPSLALLCMVMFAFLMLRAPNHEEGQNAPSPASAGTGATSGAAPANSTASPAAESGANTQPSGSH
jgi:hypothetical protein